jgi:predicted transglutaminase-like cysteine proteinase
MRSLASGCSLLLALALPSAVEARDESRTGLTTPSAIVTATASSDPGFGAPLLRASAQPVFGRAPVPIGWIQFCEERPADCHASGPAEAVVMLTPARAAQLREVNRSINAALKPVPDISHYGVPQRWTIPSDGMGSCHHYMLMKRQALARLGWPQSALLVTVVRDRRGQGHAILTVRTDQGDLVLDNLRTDVVSWRATGYEYLMRQSGTSPNRFVALSRAADVAALPAGRRRVPTVTTRASWLAGWRAAPVASGPWASDVWHPWRS